MSVDVDGVLCTWDTEALQRATRLPGTDEFVYDLAFALTVGPGGALYLPRPALFPAALS